MKKLFLPFLVMLILTSVLVSCNEGDTDESDILAKSDTPATVSSNNNSDDELQDTEKTLYELSLEAGFEGTLEEWEMAIANVKNEAGNAIECNCSKYHSGISLADALIIVQTHYFAVFYLKNDQYTMVDVAELIDDDNENWYISIAPKDVIDDEYEHIYKGQSYLYTISKETGEITKINFGGE